MALDRRADKPDALHEQRLGCTGRRAHSTGLAASHRPGLGRWARRATAPRHLEAATHSCLSSSPKTQVQAAHQLQSHLNAFRDVLSQTQQQPLSSTSITTLQLAYQRLQAAHMLIQTRFERVQHELQQANLPEAFESRRQHALHRYDRTLTPLLKPLLAPLNEWQRAPDRDALLDTATFRHTLRQALGDTEARLQTYRHEPSSPILRAQTLPVRPATPAPREPRTKPFIQQSYAQPNAPAPQPDDLTGTLDAPLDETILQQAQALDHDPVRIYEFVRNEVQPQAYAGAMKGALGTLRQLSGNAIDQASLLIALLRACSLPARYVHGVIRLPLDRLLAHLGLALDASVEPHHRALRATRALSVAGIAHRPVLEGGRISAVDLETTWVAAYVPYGNYRGTMVDASGATWIPMMPALKAVTVEPPTRTLRDLQTPVETLIADYLSQPQTNNLQTHTEIALTEEAGEPTKPPSVGSRHLIPIRLGLLPATLPVDVVAVTEETPTLDDTHRQRLRVVARTGCKPIPPSFSITPCQSQKWPANASPCPTSLPPQTTNASRTSTAASMTCPPTWSSCAPSSNAMAACSPWPPARHGQRRPRYRRALPL